MKKLLLSIFGLFLLNGISLNSLALESDAEDLLNPNDTIVFDLSNAIYSNSGGVFYIDIPVSVHSTNNGINALDFWFQFNTSKLTYVSTTSLEAGLDPFTNYNVNSQVLSNTTSGTSITYAAPLFTDLLLLRFTLASACTEIFPSDFISPTALVNGNLSSYLFIAPGEIPAFEILQPQPYCSSQNIVFNYPYSQVNGRQILSYSWDFGNGQLSSLQSDTAVYSVEGDYTVILNLTTVDGCTYSQQHAVPIYPTPVAAFSSSYNSVTNIVSFTNESSISSGTINLYNWDFGSSSSNLQSPDYTFPAMGFYDVTLTATSDLGCTNSITQLVSATDDITELNSRSLVLFPNPASNEISIQSNFHSTARIVDVTGRIVMLDFMIPANQTILLSIVNLNAGVYCLEYQDGQSFSVQRFLVE